MSSLSIYLLSIIHHAFEIYRLSIARRVLTN